MRRILRIFPLYYGVLVLVFIVAPLIPISQGKTLDYLVDRQTWAWLYGVNVYIAIQGDWSFSYLEHLWSLCIEEHFYLVWPLVVFLLARRPRTLIAVSLAIALGAMLARLTGSLMGLSWWTTYVLTPFRLDGLALGAFLAVTMRQPGGLERLVRALPRVVAVSRGFCSWRRSSGPAWCRAMSMELVLPVRAALIQILLALPAGVGAGGAAAVGDLTVLPQSLADVPRHLQLRPLRLSSLHLVLSDRRTGPNWNWPQWLGSHGAAIALQATLGSGDLAGHCLRELRIFREAVSQI